ncbi:hypothetical protein I4U23_019920 [Adineta vaga]|nr:hypothetical protein I4U23_019920 [Adineta vaga]
MHNNQVYSEYANGNNRSRRWWHRRWLKIALSFLIIIAICTVAFSLILRFVILPSKNSKDINTTILMSQTTKPTWSTTTITIAALSSTLPLQTTSMNITHQYEWNNITSMNQPRYRHTASVLIDGTVLVAGGSNDNGTLNSTELYDPLKERWITVGNMVDERWEHTTSVLKNGQVLVVGGYNDRALDSAELYNPTTQTWLKTGRMSHARYYHTASVLMDGKVLVNGGYSNSALNGAELYEISLTTPMVSKYINNILLNDTSSSNN